MKIMLPKEVEYILSTLERHGHRADIVGGTVRDFLLGIRPSDYDVTTSATPKEIKAAFSSHRTVDTGIKHGTVSLILNGVAYEITTYRIDGDYKDSRHPEWVSFTRNIADDLARRDFTINAIAYNEKDGITDLFGGRDDIERRVIRAVGDAERRFTEDALRIMRAIRFSSVLGFDIEENTKAALFDKKHLLTNVSVERIYTELRKMLSGNNAHAVLSEYLEVIAVVAPELSELQLSAHTAFSAADYQTRLFSLFVKDGVGDVQGFLSFCARLRTDAHVRDLGERVLSGLGNCSFSCDRDVLHALMQYGDEVIVALMHLEIILGRLSSAYEAEMMRILHSDRIYKLSQLELRGSELSTLGIVGKDVGCILRELLVAVIDGDCENSKGALLSYAQKVVKEYHKT